jgi:hypothetical protein
MTDCKEWSLKQIARMLAYWQGQKIVVCKPGEDSASSRHAWANTVGSSSQFFAEPVEKRTDSKASWCFCTAPHVEAG